jgi:phosphoribosylformylglycinamidine cyclo-ligase
MAMTKKISYATSGVKYELLDPIKKLAQQSALKTKNNLSPFSEISESRGESAYVWDEGSSYKAFVIEGLGTKNLVADEMEKLTGETFYGAIAQDTVAMIVNDLIVVGAKPQVINAYFAVGDSEWMSNHKRSEALIKGWAKACNLSGTTWGGGETPTLKGVINPATIDLGGACVGIINPKKRLCLGDKLVAGDRIVLIESNGIHANGLTLARMIAGKLKQSYLTKLSDGKSYGEALLAPTHIYVKLIESIYQQNIFPHYMVNITGHGWRKLMRAKQSFSYVMEKIPPVSPLFQFIQDQSGNDLKEMYGNFNMGVGFALFVAKKDVAKVLELAKKQKLKAWDSGSVEKGPKQVRIKPLNIMYTENELEVR